MSKSQKIVFMLIPGQLFTIWAESVLGLAREGFLRTDQSGS